MHRFQQEPPFIKRPEWVGVAIRYADGEAMTFEFDSRDVEVEIEREDDHDVYRFGMAEAFRSYMRRITLRVSGQTMTARHFSEWGKPRPPARPNPAGELETAPRAITAAEQALEPGPGGEGR